MDPPHPTLSLEPTLTPAPLPEGEGKLKVRLCHRGEEKKGCLQYLLAHVCLLEIPIQQEVINYLEAAGNKKRRGEQGRGRQKDAGQEW